MPVSEMILIVLAGVGAGAGVVGRTVVGDGDGGLTVVGDGVGAGALGARVVGAATVASTPRRRFSRQLAGDRGREPR